MDGSTSYMQMYFAMVHRSDEDVIAYLYRLDNVARKASVDYLSGEEEAMTHVDRFHLGWRRRPSQCWKASKTTLKNIERNEEEYQNRLDNDKLRIKSDGCKGLAAVTSRDIGLVDDQSDNSDDDSDDDIYGRSSRRAKNNVYYARGRRSW
ncbi:uncharacterized protein CCR75_000109 [Bremia lactucae]|uniref:Uncharacterized protein n=1 Tax=Bremia lactucae TaxID=4779 RepID=A0A976NY07_BRELC|nr:hypothetical protein CCR75_000109 [Bremia lactucae]